MKPIHCEACRQHFLGRPILQVEMRHIAGKYGAAAAEAELNERLEELHQEEHEGATHNG